jgi:hypothetical protein
MVERRIPGIHAGGVSKKDTLKIGTFLAGLAFQ